MTEKLLPCPFCGGEAEVTTAMETERRPEIKEAPDDSRHERKIYDLRRV